jgi:predicted phosphodiesterase
MRDAPMKIFYASDLHIEYEANRDALRFDGLDADVAILAGDIGAGVAGIEWAAEVFDIPVIYVMGNHEFYNHNYHQLRRDARKSAEALGVHLLDKDVVVLDGVRFAGCTLWTDYLANRDPALAKEIAARVMPDHFCIHVSEEALWTPEDAFGAHRDCVEWLEQQSAIDVVVTHHCPSLAAIGGRHPQNEYTPLFISALDDLITEVNAKAWVFGHTHCCVDVTHDSGTRIVSNQHGYPEEDQAEIGWNPLVTLHI